MQSQYLAQVIQQMQAQPEISTPMPDLGAMADAVKKRKAWEAANPGQSYMKQGLQNAASNLAGVPGRLAGLFSLGSR